MTKQTRQSMIKKTLTLTATSTVVLIGAVASVVPVAAQQNTETPQSPNTFSDVYVSNIDAKAIIKLADRGIAKGYPNNTFQPHNPLTMSDAIKFMGRYIEKNSDQPISADVVHVWDDFGQVTDGELLKYVNITNKMAVTNVSATEMTEQNGVLREEAAFLLVNLINKLKLLDAGEYVENHLQSISVVDIDTAKYEYQDAIKTVSFFGLSDAQEFKPKEYVTRGQFASFLMNTIEKIFESSTFKDDLYADYLFDDVKISGDGSKVFGEGAMPNSTITVKEEMNNVIGSSYVQEDSKYEVELIPKLTNGSRIAIEITDQANNTATFEKVVRLAALDEQDSVPLVNISQVTTEQDNEMQFDFMAGGNMAVPTIPTLELAVQKIANLNANNYSASSWANLQEAYTNAQQTLMDWEASEDMVNYSFDQLQSAVGDLEKQQTVQLNPFATNALDVLVMKLLEVQKGAFTEESYEMLQNTILKAIVVEPAEIADVFNELVTVASNLQLGQEEYTKFSEETTDSEVIEAQQNAVSVLQKSLQAIVFSLKQMPMDKMTKSTLEQMNQALQFAEETVKNSSTTHELTFAFTSLLGALSEVKMIENEGPVEELLLILSAQIESSTNLFPEEFSAESWEHFENTIFEATKVLESTDAEEIRETIESIQYAIYLLTSKFYEEMKNDTDVAEDSSFAVQNLSANVDSSVVDQTYSIIDYNEVEIYELKSSLQTLLNHILYVSVSNDGKDVFSSALWTSQASRQMLDIATKATRHAIYQEDITVDELSATKEMIEQQIEAYDFSKKSGSVKSTIALAKELKEKIEAADELLRQTQSDENGEYITVETYWSTQAMHDQLNDITRKSVAEVTNTNPQIIREHIKILEAAMDSFAKNRKIGKTAMTYSSDALNVDFEFDASYASVSFDEYGALNYNKMHVEKKPSSSVTYNVHDL